MGLMIGGASVRDLIMDGQPVSLYEGGSPPVKVWPTSEVYEVALTDVMGADILHPLLTVTVPAGETWDVRVQGTVSTPITNTSRQPTFVIGHSTSAPYGDSAVVDFSGTVTAGAETIAMRTNAKGNVSSWGVSFTGTVTIEK